MYFIIFFASRFVVENSKAIVPGKDCYYYCSVSCTRGSVLDSALLPLLSNNPIHQSTSAHISLWAHE